MYTMPGCYIITELREIILLRLPEKKLQAVAGCVQELLIMKRQQIL